MAHARPIDSDYFLAKAEECFCLAKLNRNVSDELEAMDQEFMATAFELDARRDNAVKKIRKVNHGR